MELYQGELCDCPFCNSSVALYTVRNVISDNGEHFIECGNCELVMTEYFFLGFYEGKNTEKDAREDIILKWNTRF